MGWDDFAKNYSDLVDKLGKREPDAGCRYCKGTGKVTLLLTSVDCDECRKPEGATQTAGTAGTAGTGGTQGGCWPERGRVIVNTATLETRWVCNRCGKRHAIARDDWQGVRWWGCECGNRCQKPRKVP